MTAKEKKYFDFCGTRQYFATLAIILAVGIFCLGMSFPFMLSASICDGNPPEAQQENVDKFYEAYSQLEDGFVKEFVAGNAVAFFIAGIICVCLAGSIFATDVYRSRNISERMRKAREEKHAQACKTEIA